MAIPEEALAELASRHKRVAVVPYGIKGVDVVLRAPTRAEYKAWRAKKDQPEAQEDAIRQCVVWCNGGGEWKDVVERFDTLLETYPALGDSRAAALEWTRFVGLTATEAGKE